MSAEQQELEKETRSYSNESMPTTSPYEPELSKVRTSTNGDIVYLGKQAFKRSDLENAFAGSLFPGVHRAPTRPMGNPVPLGLTGFSICCFVVSLVNAQARSATNVNLLAGCALFLGGVLESVAGLWCLVIENTFAATSLGAFGGFWMSYAFILGDVWGITSSYTTTEEFNNVMGFFLAAWVIFAFSMWLCTFKATYPFFLLFLFVWVFLLCLTIGSFTGSTAATKAGGVIGLLATFTGFFIVFAGVANHENSYVTIPASPMPHAPTV